MHLRRPPLRPVSRQNAARAHGRARRAFTLIELLVVVAVIVIMMSLAVPAFNTIRGGSDFTSEVYEIAGMFDQARAYATANNTYVLAGIVEVSGAQDTSANPQVTGTGRIAVALLASKSGTRPYQSLIATNSLIKLAHIGLRNGGSLPSRDEPDAVPEYSPGGFAI